MKTSTANDSRKLGRIFRSLRSLQMRQLRLSLAIRKMNAELEKEIFKRFIQRGKADRFIWMAKNPKRRKRLFDDLRDNRYFDPSLCKEVIGADKFTNPVIERLKAIGVTESIYVICSDEKFDGTTRLLKNFIEDEMWGIQEVLGYCSKSKIGFFKNHEDWFYVLSKNC